MLDIALDQHASTRVERSNGVKPGPVFVTERQVEKQILQGVNPQLFQ